MKKILFIIALLLIQHNIFSQTTSDVGKIGLSVIMPENIDGLDASQLSKLETKIIQIVGSSGLAATGYNNNFVIYPKFAVYETNTVEGGMQNIIVNTSELTLFIKQVDNNVIFSSISKSLKGSGNNKTLAITNAISKINADDTQLKTFVETGKSKIIQYYASKCDDIISKAESLVKKQDFEQALGLLMSVPEEVNCYGKIQDKSIGVYKAYQNQICSVQIHNASVSLTANDYTSALEILRQIDPTAICFKEAQLMMKKIESKITEQQKKQYDLQLKMYNDRVALEKLRISAIKEVAAAYYRGRPNTVVYGYIIR